MALADDVSYLFGQAIPDALDPILKRAIGNVLPRRDEGRRYHIAHTGAFSSRVASDLLAFGRNQRLDGAIVIVEADVLRAIYFRGGRVVGAESDVLFERLGRVLRQAGVIDDAAASALIALEEVAGVAAAASRLPPEAARFGLERRVWDIAASLFLVHHGHFIIVEGAPNLGEVQAVDLSPLDLALEGLRRYDEWRHGQSGVPIPQRPAPETRPPTAPPAVPGAPHPPAGTAVDDFIKQLREEMG